MALEVTPLEEWGATKEEATKLPSGKVAILRDTISVYSLARRGQLDAELLLSLGSGELDDPSQVIELQDAIAVEMFVKPRVVLSEDERDAGSILIDQVDDEDLTFVVEKALGVFADAESFPDQSGSGGSSEDSGAVRSKTKRTTQKRSARVPSGSGASSKTG
jgi:hypothetical protein